MMRLQRGIMFHIAWNLWGIFICYLKKKIFEVFHVFILTKPDSLVTKIIITVHKGVSKIW